jgi:hypothetical protein
MLGDTNWDRTLKENIMIGDNQKMVMSIVGNRKYCKENDLDRSAYEIVFTEYDLCSVIHVLGFACAPRIVGKPHMVLDALRRTTAEDVMFGGIKDMRISSIEDAREHLNNIKFIAEEAIRRESDMFWCLVEFLGEASIPEKSSQFEKRGKLDVDEAMAKDDVLRAILEAQSRANFFKDIMLMSDCGWKDHPINQRRRAGIE